MSPTPIASYHNVNGVRLCVFEWEGEGRPLFFAHATGFHARLWDQVISALPGRRCYALDFRGHGRSDKPEPPYPWRAFGEDLAALVSELGIEGAVGVGHSKGGHALVTASSLAPGAFAALLLADPVIMPREAYREMEARRGERGGSASRRRNQFASLQEMFERFKERPPFDTWQPQVLRDYCEHGLVPNPDGEGYVLACPPHIEAAIYDGSSGGGDIYAVVEATTIPVTVLRARERDANAGPGMMSGSPTAPDLAQHFGDGKDVSLPQYSHFLAMENPALIARYTEDLETRIA